jgi:hypothetical protein
MPLKNPATYKLIAGIFSIAGLFCLVQSMRVNPETVHKEYRKKDKLFILALLLLIVSAVICTQLLFG